MPPAREIMLAVTDPLVKELTVMSCSQLLKSELLNNVTAYHIAMDPCPIIIMQPTSHMAQAYSKDRIDPMIRDTPILTELVSEKKSRDSNNTILHKQFPGGQLTMIGANSPSELASRPVRIILCDEIDRYPDSSGKEGDPVDLIAERAGTFFNRKQINTSTPTIEGRSKIENKYLLSDQRVHCGTCPHCNVGEEMSFQNVKWTDNDPSTAHYQCPLCAAKWTEPDRIKAIKNGFYRANAPFKGHAGFKVTKVSSPWEPLSVLVKKFLDAKDNSEKLKVFVNTQLAETWVERGEAPDHQRLYERREGYKQNSIPKGVVFLTAGVDIQKDRIEVEIVGWGRDKQSWSIDYRYYMGDTALDQVWLELDKVLNETWKDAENRELKLRMMAVDSGYNTQHVYSWVRKHPTDRVRAVKGQDNITAIFSAPRDAEVARDGSKLRHALKVWHVGVSLVKSELYSWLKLNQPEDGKEYPSGYLHFPEYDLEHFRRLSAEHLMKRTLKGRTTYRWEKKYERNEQLDCRVYARAAAAMFGLDRLSTQEWDILEGKPIEEPKAKAPLGREVNPPKPLDAQSSSFWARQNRKKLF